MPRHGLARQLVLAFALVSATTAVIAAVILGLLWQQLFATYVAAGLQSRADGLASALALSYAENGGWSASSFADLAHLGMMDGARIQIFDASDRLLVDNADLFGTGTALGGQLKGPVGTSAVIVRGNRVGIVKVASAGGVLMSERDMQFRNVSLRGLALAALIALGLSTAAGVLYSRRLSAPIRRVTETAASLRAGERDARTYMEGNDEVHVLGRTLDEMADAIEADRAFERQLTADVAHELRTPLQAIQATVEAMQDGVMPADPERLGVVRDETVRLSRLADSLLDLSRIERGEAALKKHVVDVEEPVRSALDAHRALIEATGLTLVDHLEHGLYAEVDPDRLRQAIGNLLSNAARYTPEGGQVTVRLYRDEDSAVMSVSDTGIGIPEADREKVFRRFWRADEARERSRGGAGIGLALFKEIIERHGGLVGLTPVDPTGITFWARLPLYEETEPAGSPQGTSSWHRAERA